MRKSVLAVAAAALVAVPASASPAISAPLAPSSEPSFSFVSAPGDVIGQGQSRNWTSLNTKYLVRGNASDLTFNVRTNQESWDVRLVAPAGETLTPGSYPGAERAGTQTGRAAGLSVSGAGRSCADVWGGFAVHQIETFPDGGVRSLEVTFDQRCDAATAPLLTGTVRFQTRPLSYSYNSEAGDPLGRGAKKTHLGATTTFRLAAAPAGIEYLASGQRENWRIALAPATGTALTEGSYAEARRVPDAAHPGLNVSVNGRECTGISGGFVITEILFDATGEPLWLSATFDVHCDASTYALHGTIRYRA